jgi:serine/threonine-protein kinase HipA
MPEGRVVVDVYAESLWPTPIGQLHGLHTRGTETFSFTYAPDWLQAQKLPFPIDPHLSLYEGPLYFNQLPGIFSDSAPDRWGERLMDRREMMLANREQRQPRSLSTLDYLLGVNDATRMGGLRFRRPVDGVFVAEDPFPVPAETSLREIQHYVRVMETNQHIKLTDEQQWIKMLIAPGSSLGGARPKATYRDPDGSLWMAKFRSRGDTYDVGLWEFVLTNLAELAGIEVPPTKLLSADSEHHIFCAKRFDRKGEERIVYASAMTLAEKRDHGSASYLDIANALSRFGGNDSFQPDLEQMFRRAAFNILVAHRDDHLRNHGFLLANGGWRLAPAFDLNPLPSNLQHDLAIDDSDHAPSIETLIRTTDFYNLDETHAKAIVGEVRDVVSTIVDVAVNLGVGRSVAEDIAAAISDFDGGVGW